MPPKKVVKTLDKTVQEKEKRRRLKNGKCLPLSVTEENINIQDLNLTLVGRQFKKKSLLKDPRDALVLKVMNQPQGKIIRKKKTVLKRKIPLKNNKNVSINIEGEPVTKRRRRRVSPKKLEDKLVVKEKCDSTEAFNVENNVTTEEYTRTTKPRTPRRKALNSNIARPRTRKKANDEAKLSQFEAITDDDALQKDNVENGKKQDILEVRRNSLASVSELSWTKDITSSSTTTCVTVTSNDFFRIDKKIPIVMLTNVDHKLIGEENNNISKVGSTEAMAVQYEDTTKKSHIETNDNCIDEVDFPCPESPNLSSSSSESCSDREKSIQSVSTAINRLSNTLQKLSSKLKNFDLEIINWIGYTDDTTNPNIEKIQEKLYRDNFLKDEMKIITHCQNIKRILSENNKSIATPENEKTDDDIIKSDREHETHKNPTLTEANNPKYDELNSPKESLKILSNVIVQRNSPKEMDKVLNKSADNRDNITHDEDDEDDALSLFAESITCIEPSSRKCTSHGIKHPKGFEEYVPVPVIKTDNNPENITYNPTKIISSVQVSEKEDDPVIVCEKQSADSTSVCKEQDNDKNLETSNILVVKSKDVEDVSRKENSITKTIPQNPHLMSSMYKAVAGIKSVVFKGVCFYNLISKCKRNGCCFSHMPVGIDSVKVKLRNHNDTTLIQEYMLIRIWPGLRQKYGMCFVEEFIKRDLTKMIVETAFDFIIKDNNEALIIDIVEHVLLYLNKVDLCSIEDLLKLNIKASKRLLCDIFISTIAQSQNFSRFKSVFINLTNLMYRLGRCFSEDVAGHVLERIVILPYDEGLARALIKIIRNTDISIYSNSMVSHLEQQLRSSNIMLYKEFISLKNQALSHSAVDSCYTDGDRSQLDNIRCSPDTTNLDNMNKSIETKFTRTIDINKILLSNVNAVDLNKDIRFTTNQRFMSWIDRNSYGNTRNVPRKTTMRPPLRPPFKRRLDQKFDGSPSKYQRRNGSKFYNDFP
ncbi:uncharacterized protein LOC126775240 isoform X2 [Nymphalis io]|uniref:uncharacterized protein LOC126775240 isoform X2 n=1 Tax=Inachis io TaxID=171585 RepID=UPI00216A1D92|nr:uncharacterized protein LOC126775240 isoform X2 [Nymphalis io]